MRTTRGGGTRLNAEERSIIGASPAIRALRRLIRLVGPSDATILIQGERGTGKELVAEALVAASHRRHRPFMRVNCAALPPELLASELFGHERGAFTGAAERRPGVLPAAAGGTVFLDEIGDLGAQGQAMLLRFVQGREVRALGSVTTTAVDVRIIAATNRDLRAAAARGEFRADLYDRLNGITLVVPPLRARAEDIPRLVDHFLAQYTGGRAIPPLMPRVRQALAAYDWPGNVRELEWVIARAVLHAGRRPVTIGDLGLPAFSDTSAAPGHRLTGRQQFALRIATAKGYVRREDLIHQLSISGEAARRDLVTLTRMGLVERVGRGRGTHYRLVAEGQGEDQRS